MSSTKRLGKLRHTHVLGIESTVLLVRRPTSSIVGVRFITPTLINICTIFGCAHVRLETRLSDGTESLGTRLVRLTADAVFLYLADFFLRSSQVQSLPTREAALMWSNGGVFHSYSEHRESFLPQVALPELYYPKFRIMEIIDTFDTSTATQSVIN